MNKKPWKATSNKANKATVKKNEVENIEPLTGQWNEQSSDNSETTVVSTADLQALLNRVTELEKKSEEWVPTIGKKYEWPMYASYSMRGWVPIISRTSEKKDKTRSFRYKNEHNAVVNNHYVRLELANWKNLLVDVEEFNAERELSKKQPIADNKDSKWTRTIVFVTEEYGEVTLLPAYIN